MMHQAIISPKGFDIRIYSNNFNENFISLTDIAKYKNNSEPNDVIKKLA